MQSDHEYQRGPDGAIELLQLVSVRFNVEFREAQLPTGDLIRIVPMFVEYRAPDGEVQKLQLGLDAANLRSLSAKIEAVLALEGAAPPPHSELDH